MLFIRTPEELSTTNINEYKTGKEDKYNKLLVSGDEVDNTYTILGKINDNISSHSINLIEAAEDMYQLLYRIYYDYDLDHSIDIYIGEIINKINNNNKKS